MYFYYDLQRRSKYFRGNDLENLNTQNLYNISFSSYVKCLLQI